MLSDKKQAKADYDRRRRAEKKVEIAAAKRAYYLANKDKENARVAAWVEENKPRSLEIKKTYRDANKDKDRAYRAANAFRIAANNSARYRRNAEALKAYGREYYEANKPKIKLYARAYQLAKPWVHRNIASRRRSGVSQATPAWADMAEIRCIYTEARYLQMEVDHIVPLVGVNKHGEHVVCGLHVEYNLQSLTMVENRRKGNRHAS